jgi:hypothetical protein
MSDASPASIDYYPAFLARLPPDLDLEALGRETQAFRRPRGVRSATDLLRLALAWGPGGYSLQRVVAWAGAQGIADLTDEVLTQRPHATVPFLEAVTSHLLRPTTPVPCWQGRVLRITRHVGNPARSQERTRLAPQTRQVHIRRKPRQQRRAVVRYQSGFCAHLPLPPTLHARRSVPNRGGTRGILTPVGQCPAGAGQSLRRLV